MERISGPDQTVESAVQLCGTIPDSASAEIVVVSQPAPTRRISQPLPELARLNPTASLERQFLDFLIPLGADLAGMTLEPYAAARKLDDAHVAWISADQVPLLP